jgi:hypothetical protein
MPVLKLSASGPVEGNFKGSYLSMTSKDSLYFGIIHITAYAAWYRMYL